MINQTLAEELNLKEWQVQKIVSLIDEGNTIPFIARYRKDMTGSVNDETLRKFNERLKYLRNLEDKKEIYLKRIESQGKLTKSLKSKILHAKTLVELEDLYLPYKSKKRTRATIAREKGLEKLAEIILKQQTTIPIEKIAEKFISNEVKDMQKAIDGAKDIIAEIIAENCDFRKKIRENTYYHGIIQTKNKKNEPSEYEIYYNYQEKISKIPSYRLLAINRAEKEDYLKVKIDIDDKDILNYLNRHVLKNISKNPKKIKYNPYTTDILKESIKDSYKRLIKPSIDREIRNQLTEKAEDKSIEVFSKNLHQLLMESPLEGKTILGWDPAFKTGCKLAIIDSTGNVLQTALIYPTAPQRKVEESKKIVKDLIEKHSIDVIAIGNGTACQESEEVVADIIKGTPVEYIIVNEAGASVYSASDIGSEEFPDLNEGERSAISIARRLQDPLAELVKIDPKSIGVGQYQHDMNQRKLNDSLENVVEKVVNNVGVDLNTASASLLNYISGINKTIAKNIVEYRNEKGEFKSRKDLLKVKKLGKKTFQQCAGFIKVNNSSNPLDNTTIHPESYESCKKLLDKLGYSLEDIKSKNIKFNQINYEKLAQELEIGEITLKDIIQELQKPCRDPRETMPKPILKKNITTIDDLEENMIVKGTVRNIVDFGAFVDIGVHQDGLVHISQLVENKFVKHPLDVVSVGEVVDVKILEVNKLKNRIELSMII